MRERVRRDPTLRVVLFVGFGLTVGLWAFVGARMTREMADAQRDAAALDARYATAQDALASVRSGVLLVSVIVRDTLLSTEPRSVAAYRGQIADADADIQKALDQYQPVLGSAAELERLERLKQEVAAFRRTSAEILSRDPANWQAEARSLLRLYMPSREKTIAVSEEAQTVNRSLYIEQRRVTETRLAELQSTMWQMLGLAIGLSLVIAWLASRQATRLEGTLLAQHAREEETSAALQRLSARLVDVREEEQRRIARELHDEVGQGLSAVQLELAVAQKRIQRAGLPDDILNDARTTTEGVLRNVRDLSQLLHPSVLDDLGLSAALDSYVRLFAKRTGITVDFVDHSGGHRPPLSVERATYRVVQEALTNVLKHAKASTVGVTLRTDERELVATIEDDGVGFDAAAEAVPGRRCGLGLLGIRERVAQLDGTVQIDSAPGRGTRLCVTIPTPAVSARRERMEPDESAAALLPEASHG